MELGICLPQLGPTAEGAKVAEVARRAEKVGYDSLWVGDRLLTPESPQDLYPVGGTPEVPYPPEFTAALDPIVTLTAAAAVTSRVKLSFSTLIPTWHNAVLLARALTTLDAVSEGRLELGLGTSWMRDEYEVAGVPWEERGARLDEMLDVFDKLWSDTEVEHRGRFWEIPPSKVDLRPVRAGGPAVLLGGFTPAAMARAGSRGAGWIAIAGAPEEFEESLWGMAVAAAEGAGRDPGELRRETRVNTYAGEDIGATVDQVREAERRGADGVHVDF
ncbi:MAG: TIGR03619 family F420-dependent LLM class oxidoreductase, partial [Actinobacteria bacterium]|nr:TIGR03619 family F420-dependent LLM class oxidoreductase [Actinomycetota bacterium]